MGAEAVTRALRGRWYGAYGAAYCLAHRNRRTPALSLSDGEGGRLLVHCFSGCDPVDVLGALRARGLMDGNALRETARAGASNCAPGRRHEAEKKAAGVGDAHLGESAVRSRQSCRNLFA